jgi:hypothetical protein
LAAKIDVIGLPEHLPVFQQVARNNFRVGVLEHDDLVLDLGHRGLTFRVGKIGVVPVEDFHLPVHLGMP